MTLDLFDRCIDLIVRSGMRDARLLGGEPTLHPNFLDIVDRVLGRGLNLMLFTGGLVSSRVLDRLQQIEPDRLTVLVNVIEPTGGHPSTLRRQHLVCERLGRRVILGLNISSRSTPMSFLLDEIDRYGLRRQVRLGLAHPAVGACNDYLHPRDYPEVGRQAAEFARQAQDRNVRIDWDCGWVPCMFPDGALEALGLESGNLGQRCSPILDVLPDGRVISCYPLAALGSEELSDEVLALDLRERFRGHLASHRHFTLLKQCADCHLRALSCCSGGCQASGLRRARQGVATAATVRAQPLVFARPRQTTAHTTQGMHK